MNAMADWFYKQGNEVRGPVSRQELDFLLQSGRLHSVTEVRQGSDGRWTKLASPQHGDAEPRPQTIGPRPGSMSTVQPAVETAATTVAAPPPLVKALPSENNNPTRRQVLIGVVLSALLLFGCWILWNSNAATGTSGNLDGSGLAQTAGETGAGQTEAGETNEASPNAGESTPGTTAVVSTDTGQTPMPPTPAVEQSDGAAVMSTSASANKSGDGDANEPTTTVPPSKGVMTEENPPPEAGTLLGPELRTPGDPLSKFTISAPGEATFFGLSATGHRFAFVVDRSGSMAGPPLERAKEELLRCLRGLPEGTEVLVIFYDNFATPDPVGYRRTGPGQLKLLGSWVNSQGVGGGTDAETGLRQAFVGKDPPDAIFLLTDGAIDPSTAAAARQLNPDTKVRINTIALTSQDGEAILKQIAKENNGDYRFVP